MPEMPISTSASFTASSFDGCITASIFCIVVLPYLLHTRQAVIECVESDDALVREVISLFAVLRQVEPGALVLFAHPEARLPYPRRTRSSVSPQSTNTTQSPRQSAWFNIWPLLPSNSPVALPAPNIGLMALLAKTPVSNAPIVPPAP